MATYQIQGPDGNTYDFQAPDSATQDEVLSRFKSEFAKMSKPEPTSTASAMLQGAGQGLTFGFSDEIEGGARALYDTLVGGKDFSKSYDKRLATARQRLKSAQNTNPYAFYGAELGSAVLVPGGLARAGIGSLSKAAARQTLGRRSLQSAKEGALYGAAYGAGTGEGVEGRLSGAATGGLLGASVGAAIPGAVDLAGATVRSVANPIRGYTSPNRVASEKYAEAVARDLGSTKSGSDFDAAARRMAARAKKVDPQSPMMSMDLAGENTRRLVRQAADMPSSKVQAFSRRLDIRQQGQPERLEKALAKTIGDPKVFAREATDIIERRKEAAKPNFEKAMAKQIRFPPRMTEFFNRPTMQGILKNVERSMADAGLEPSSQNAMQIVHRVKMELDEQIATAARAKKMGTGGNSSWNLNDLMGLKNTLVSYARKENPAYAKALDEYAGQSAMLSAIRDGAENFFKLPVEELPGTLNKLTKSEKDMWLIGAARAIAGKIRTGNRTNDRTKNVFGTPDMDMRLKAIMPNAKMRRRFQRMVSQEARMSLSRAKVQGNSTTSQNLIQADEAGKAVRAVSAAGQAMTGRMGGLMNVLEGAGNRISGLTPETAGAILRNAMYPAHAYQGPYVQNAIRKASQRPINRARLVAPVNAGFGAFRDQ